MSTEANGLAAAGTVLVSLAARDGAATALPDALRRVAAEVGLPPDLTRAYHALHGHDVTAYLGGQVEDEGLAAVREATRRHLGPLATSAIEVSRLRTCLSIAGASAGSRADYHYVVRTDVAPGGEHELERWYDDEHMPSLAAVPGAVLARRLIACDTTPVYYACYDLTAPDVLRSDAWLAVRATDWSGRVRPTFRDTRRTMYRRLVEAT